MAAFASDGQLVIEAAACFVGAMTGADRSMRGLSAPLRCVLLMLLGNLCVAGMTGTIRVAAAELPPLEIAFLRNRSGPTFPSLWIGGGVIFAATLYIVRARRPRPQRPGGKWPPQREAQVARRRAALTTPEPLAAPRVGPG